MKGHSADKTLASGKETEARGAQRNHSGPPETYEGQRSHSLGLSIEVELEPLDERYEIHEHLGDGGSASVYRAEDHHLRRPVAVKRYFTEGIGEQSIARFWREARLTGWLAHPNIVPVYDVLRRDDGGCDLIMKLVEGKTLADRILDSMSGPTTADGLAQHLRDLLKVCDALAFAHSRGVIHRDLKPANIMVGEHGEVYVMDWGLAKVLPGGGPPAWHSVSGAPPATAPEPQQPTVRHTAHSTDTNTPHAASGGRLIGTPVYMSPEQASGQGDAAGIELDVFGLGAVLYEILTGYYPYVGATLPQVLAAARARNLVPPDERAPDRTVSPELRRLCLKAMAKDPADRYARVTDFALELRAVLNGGGWFETENYAPGEFIVREHQSSDRAFVITGGHCRAVKGPEGSQQELRTMGPGDVFGEVGLITGDARSASIIAIDQVSVQVISSQGLKYELEHLGLVGKFLDSLAGRFRDIDEKLFQARQSGRPPT